MIALETRGIELSFIHRGFEQVLSTTVNNFKKLGQIFKGDIHVIADMIDNPNKYEVELYNPDDARAWLQENNIIVEGFITRDSYIVDVPSYFVITKKQG